MVPPLQWGVLLEWNPNLVIETYNGQQIHLPIALERDCILVFSV